MPLTLLPVPFLSDPNPKDKEQKPIVPAPSTRRAITLKLPIEVARALKDATANAKPGGQPAVRVTLNGDKPGLTISGQLFPFDLALKPANGPNNVAELYSRTRHQYPRKPADHRPPLALQSVIVGHAVVEDAAQKLRDRMAEAGQAKKDKRIQLIETPPATTSGAGAKGSAAGTKKKKNVAPRTATASTLERDALLRKGAMKATPAAPAASSSMSAPSSNRASPSTVNHRQTPATSSSTPTSPATSPVDTRPLEERIIHQLATKSQTIQELEGLLGANKDDISEILRRVATTHDPSSSSGNWTTTPKGPWALKLSSYALLHPWTWPAYTDHDRQRIAKDMEHAFDQQGLSRDAPERLKLQDGEARWRKKMAARSASGTPVPGTTQRKLKMNKISEPPNATGGTLSASSVKQGIKSTSANGTSTTSTKKKAAKVDGTGSTKGSDVEMKEKPKKRPSPTESSRSGAATPMSASSSNGSTSSSTSTSAPLRHGLPPKPPANLNPPSSSAQHAGHSSRTPPPPRPSATPTQSPRPSHSAASPKTKVSSATSKRKHDEMSDLDDALLTGKTKGSRPNLPASSASGSIPQEAKRRKLEPSPLGAGSSTAASSRTGSASSIAVANGAVVKSKREAGMRDDAGSASSSQGQQSLKPPPPQVNGRGPPAPSRSASVATAKSDRDTAQLPKFGRKEPSPLGPSALSKSVNGREKFSSSTKTEERAHSRTSGKGRATPVFTSSEEEEDPEVAAEAARKAATKRKKLALAAAAPSPAAAASQAPRLRKVKALPRPLPTDRKELRLLHGDKYPEMLASYAELQAEKARAERCAAEQGDPSTLWSEAEFRAKVNEYNTLHSQVKELREAVDASLRGDGQD